MRRTLVSFAFALLSLTAFCQGSDAYKSFVSRIDGSRAEFGYTYTIGSETKIYGQGTATVQDECFFLSGDGVEIYCDGQTAATLDRSAKELVLESVEGEDQGNYVNPAVLVNSVAKHFNCVSQTKAKYAGRTSVKVVLEPKSKTDVLRLDLQLSPDGSALMAASLVLDDGTKADFDIKDFRFVSQGPVTDFRLDSSSLGKDFIITDLR